MILEIDDTWSVHCDDTCYSLIMKKVVEGGRGRPAKAENIGKEREVNMGFYGTLEQALNGYLHKSINTTDAVFSIPQLITAIKKAEETIKGIKC